MKRLLVVVFVLVSYISTAANGHVEITDLKPTPFFPKVGKYESLKQIVQVSVSNTSIEIPVRVRISVDGHES